MNTNLTLDGFIELLDFIEEPDDDDVIEWPDDEWPDDDTTVPERNVA